MDDMSSILATICHVLEYLSITSSNQKNMSFEFSNRKLILNLILPKTSKYPRNFYKNIFDPKNSLISSKMKNQIEIKQNLKLPICFFSCLKGKTTFIEPLISKMHQLIISSSFLWPKYDMPNISSLFFFSDFPSPSSIFRD
jgi:hypothetical protein